MSGTRINPTTEPCLDCGATGLLRMARRLCMACYARRRHNGLPMPEKMRQGTKAAPCPNCGAPASSKSSNETARGIRRVHVCRACGHRHVRFDGVLEELAPPPKAPTAPGPPNLGARSRRKKAAPGPKPLPPDPGRATLRDRLAARRAAELGLTLAEHRMLIGIDR